METDVGLIIPAAGAGTRFGAGGPKALSVLAGSSLVTHAVQAAVRSGVVDSIVIAAPPGLVPVVIQDVTPHVPDGIGLNVVEGGLTRQESVFGALDVLQADLVLVHDAARCLAPPALFTDVVTALRDGRTAVVPGLPVVDTLKEISPDGDVISTPDRSRLRAVQTPQGFQTATLRKAHQLAVDRGRTEVTDDAGLVEWAGGSVHVIAGHHDAFKITHPPDLRWAETILAAQGGGA